MSGRRSQVRVPTGGTTLKAEVTGAGEPVVMVMGSGAAGRVWHLHQVPALVAAGYQVVTFDSRGLSPEDTGDFTLADMVDDTVALIEHFGFTRCRLVGFSLGAMIVQELLVERPDLVGRAVLMATRGRTDAMRLALSRAERDLYDAKVELPAEYRATVQMMRYLSHRTMDDEDAARYWLEVFEIPEGTMPGLRRQLELDELPDRLPAYRAISTPTLVMGFGDDLLCPPHMVREVADAIPGARYLEVAGCGHLGYMEQSGQVNGHLLEFLAS
ncbi:alpha/beta fold hydrolase [Streptomyces sp. Ju416(a)]|uniref:alpha/beta fold hydrolase n=1 Tax=Streptomyces sp. Ju416(a) TaxID=3446591 RepID=UPI0026D5D009